MAPSPAPSSSGICSSHHCITRSLLEKKRWPPISIRLPLYRTVRDMPPISREASMTIGLISDCFRNSSAAVSPAGPAPIIKAFLPRSDLPSRCAAGLAVAASGSETVPISITCATLTIRAACAAAPLALPVGYENSSGHDIDQTLCCHHPNGCFDTNSTPTRHGLEGVGGL